MEDKTTQPPDQTDGPGSRDDLRGELCDSLLYTYNRINANTSKIHESATFLYAFIELLSEKGASHLRNWKNPKSSWGNG